MRWVAPNVAPPLLPVVAGFGVIVLPVPDEATVAEARLIGLLLAARTTTVMVA
mgnify:CR=1 FL=1